jgi:hypothetical protein
MRLQGEKTVYSCTLLGIIYFDEKRKLSLKGNATLSCILFEQTYSQVTTKKRFPIFHEPYVHWINNFLEDFRLMLQEHGVLKQTSQINEDWVQE